MLESSIRIFFATNNPRAEEIRQIRDIEGMRSFQQVDFRGNGFAEQNFGSLDIRWMPSIDAAIRMIVAGRADIFVGNDLIGRHTVRSEGLSDQIDNTPVSIGSVNRYRLGVRKSLANADAVLGDFDAAVRTMRQDGRLEGILARYV